MKLIKILLCAAIIFSATTADAARVGLSSDNVENFIGKCNAELQAGGSSLDIPTVATTLKYYSDTLQVGDNLQVKATYIFRDDKLYSIKLQADRFDSQVRTLFEGMNIVYLKSLGLTTEEAKGLTNSGEETEWTRQSFISRLNKRFIVEVKNSALNIIAQDR